MMLYYPAGGALTVPIRSDGREMIGDQFAGFPGPHASAGTAGMALRESRWFRRTALSAMTSVLVPSCAAAFGSSPRVPDQASRSQLLRLIMPTSGQVCQRPGIYQDSCGHRHRFEPGSEFPRRCRSSGERTGADGAHSRGRGRPWVQVRRCSRCELICQIHFRGITPWHQQDQTMTAPRSGG